MKTYTFLVLMMLLSAATMAQQDSLENNFTIGTHILTHGEACGGGLPKGAYEDKSYFVMGRFRVITDYQRTGLQAHAVLENSAVWGMSGNQALRLYEGWVKMSTKSGLFAQVGRIALAYDDERIIGLNDFATAALSHDVLRLGYEGHGHKVHAILAYNQNGDSVYHSTFYTDGAQLYKTMQTLWYHYDVPSFPLGVSLLFMNLGLQAGKTDPTAWDYETNKPRTVNQQMYGTYINFHPKRFTLEGSYYRQSGKDVNNEKYAKKIRAWMASVKATVNPSDRYGFLVGYDHLSGDDYVPVTYGGLGLVRHDVLKGFTPLYGSRTKFYGVLDFFYQSAYINGFTPGLQNVFVGTFGVPVKNLDCGLTYHYMATATELSNLNRTLGHAFEFNASYQFCKDITLYAGYTFMDGTDTMARLKQGEGNKTAHWGWFSLIVSPDIFKTKW